MIINLKSKKAHPGEKDKTTHRLAGFLFITLVIVFLLLSELLQITIFKHQYYLALAHDQQRVIQNVSPKRGHIYATDPFSENNQTLLAESVERFALSVTPKNVPKGAYNQLATILDDYLEDYSREEILAIFSKNSMYAPPLKHGLSKKDVESLVSKINPKTKINFDESAGDIIYFTKGIIFIREFNRFYPQDNLASHILGFVNYEGQGKYGIEDYADQNLRGIIGTIAAEKDNRGEILGQLGAIRTKDGSDVVLTIDVNIQFYVQQRLTRAIEDYQAESGTVIIMEPKTGAVVALANLPDYNPNDFKKTEYQRFINAGLSQQFEAGSVMKPFTVAAALDLGLVTPDTKSDFPSSVTIGSYTISNVADHAYPNSTVTNILDNSINTGTVWLSEKLGNEHFYNYLKNFGFGQKTNIDLPNEITGSLPEWTKWKDIHRATISFGQGDAITAIQLITAYSAIANKGILMEPYIIKDEVGANGRHNLAQPKEVKRVITEETAKKLLAMLEHVVEFGHAKRAAVPGYKVGGKTGTAQIPVGGSYSEEETTQTFAGIGPINDPKFVTLVILNKPKNSRFADSSTVYVFSDIARFLFNYWKIPPQ